MIGTTTFNTDSYYRYKLNMSGVSTYSYHINYIRQDTLSNYPFLKSLKHLKRLNKYRKRVGQSKVEFDDDDMLELILLKG